MRQKMGRNGTNKASDIYYFRLERKFETHLLPQQLLSLIPVDLFTVPPATTTSIH